GVLPTPPPSARARTTAIAAIEALHDAPIVREFAIRFDAPVERVLDHCAAAGIGAGVPLGDEYANGLLVAITEQRTIAQIDRLAEVLEEDLRRTADSREPAGA